MFIGVFLQQQLRPVLHRTRHADLPHTLLTRQRQAGLPTTFYFSSSNMYFERYFYIFRLFPVSTF